MATAPSNQYFFQMNRWYRASTVPYEQQNAISLVLSIAIRTIMSSICVGNKDKKKRKICESEKMLRKRKPLILCWYMNKFLPEWLKDMETILSNDHVQVPNLLLCKWCPTMIAESHKNQLNAFDRLKKAVCQVFSVLTKNIRND